MAIEIDDGTVRERIEARVRSGEYDSTDDVIRAGMEALDRKTQAFDALLRARVREALDDPRPAVPAADVFARLERRFESDLKTARLDA